MPASITAFAASLSTSRGASLYSESFDSAASAKVIVNKLANADLAYVDYSSFVRDQPGAGGPVTIKIPEAPNRISGSVATRGVLLNATYAGTARNINILAATAPSGAGVSFSGNYRMSFDLWMAIDPTATAGTTEVGLFGLGQTAVSRASLQNRTTGIGTYGWLSAEGGVGGAGDMSLFTDGVAGFINDLPGAPPDPVPFTLAFAQATPVGSNAPNNQWSNVVVTVVGTTATVFINGVKFGETGAAANTSGFAALGYEDPFTGSTPGGFNRQFAIFDNWKIDSIAAAPALEASVTTVFPRVVELGQASIGEFSVVNSNSATSYNILSAAIDGQNGTEFTLAPTVPATMPPTFPIVVPPLESVPLSINFIPSTPNGLKVARLTLTTSDPNFPVIVLPLQATRDIPSLLAAITTRIVSVAVTGGTGTGVLTVTNNGPSAVTISNPQLTGTDSSMFALTSTFPIVILSMESADLPVVFTPTGAAGLKSASVGLNSTDAGVPTLSIPLLSRYAFGPPLLAHYKMDDISGTTLVDNSGASPAAALQIREAPFGFGQTSLLPGGAGTAVRLTSADSSITGNFAISNAVHLPNVSYSMWIKPEPKPTTNRRILHRSSLFTTIGTLYSLYLTPEGKLVFEVNSATAVETADGAIVDGMVYHIAITHSDLDAFGNTAATRTRLYINGVMLAEKTADVMGYTDYNLNTTAAGLYIGTATSAGQGYTGILDDLQIYSVELSSGQIAGIYGQPGKTAFNLEMLDYRITSVQYNPGTGTVTLTWNSSAGATYSVQESTTVSGFTNVSGQSSIPSGGVTTNTTFTATAGPRRFFQIRRTSPP